MGEVGVNSAGSAGRGLRVLYVEPFSGISGDMMLGALLDLGADLGRVANALSTLPLAGYRLASHPCSRSGIRALRFEVELGGGNTHAPHAGGHDAHHRSYRDIRAMLEASGLSDWVKAQSIAAFEALARAEGRIHQTAVEDVHFHEIGAVDSIIDIVGCMIALEPFLPLKIISAPVNVGRGTLECSHGTYPVPAPATEDLLRGVPTFTNEIRGELTTPTGAALLVTLAGSFGGRPPMCVEAVGYGAGSRETPGASNVLRLSLGREETEGFDAGDDPSRVAVIEAAVDDMNPQVYGYFQEKALAAGALDVYATSVIMKKNRPGILITVVCPEASLDALCGLLLSETSTIGVRHYFAARRTLDRRIFEVATRFGCVRVKVSRQSGRRANFSPEYEDCRRLAEASGAPLKEVMAEAARAFLNGEAPTPGS